MNFAIAAPLILGLANTTAKAVQETASGMFSLLADSQSSPVDVESASSGTTPYFTGIGQLGLENAEISINKSLQRLENLIRTHFSQSKPPLPDNFQLQIDVEGKVHATGAGELDFEIERIIQDDAETTQLVRHLATEFAALAKSRRNQEYAHRYNSDPQSADAWLASVKKESNAFKGVDVHFSPNSPPVYHSLRP
jgi:hypothetical protein